jgi:hypothetical protein
MHATSAGEWGHCGRVFSATEIAELCATVAWLPGLARKELAATVCEHLGWTTLTATAFFVCGSNAGTMPRCVAW